MYDRDSYAIYCFYFLQEHKQHDISTNKADKSLVSECEAYLADNL